MKKVLILLYIVALPLILMAQIPSGYYDGMEGKSGAVLKTALYNKIKGHTARTYDNLWTDFQRTDKRADGKVWDMYSSCTFTFTSNQCGNYSKVCDCYNREHSFPKSWFDDATPMYTDLFHLYPTDGYTNGRRSNYPFGEVGSATWSGNDGCKLGASSYPGYTGTVFEPASQYKGDFARTYFYMVTRYEDVVANWYSNTEAKPTLNGTTYPAFNPWVISVLLKWHKEDPVSAKEIARNDSVYKIQKNRNPFIDHPEYANAIWDSVAPINITISNVRLTPSVPNVSQSPTVSAKIQVSKSGVVLRAYLKWGVVSGALNDSVQMVAADSNYSAQILTQSVGTKVYYSIAASASTSRSVTPEQSYTVVALPDTVPPVLSEPNVVYADEEFNVSVKATDARSGIKSVRVYIGATAEDVSQENYTLQPRGAGVYGVTFFPLFNFRPVYFKFEACDSVNNCATLRYVYGQTGVARQPQVEFTLYPNPANSEVNIRLQDNISVNKIEVFDSRGLLVLQGAESTILNIKELNSGVYFVRVVTANGVGVQKLSVKK